MAVDNKVDSNTVDPKASAIDEAAATDATNDGITPDDKTLMTQTSKMPLRTARKKIPKTKMQTVQERRRLESGDH